MIRIPLVLAIAAIQGSVMLAAETDTDRELKKFFRSQYIDQLCKISPVTATRMGDHSFDDKMDDASPEGLLAYRVWLKTTREGLAKIDRSKLTRDGRIDYDIFHDRLIRLQYSADTKAHTTDPRFWSELISDSVFLILTQNTSEQPKRLRDAAARIERIPQVVKWAMASLDRPPAIWAETGVKQNKGSIDFYRKGIFELTGEDPKTSALAKPCQAAVEALTEYQTFLEKTIVPKAVGDWRLGVVKFNKKLALELEVGPNPPPNLAEQVLKQAEEEADRVRKEMYFAAKQFWTKFFPGKALPPDDDLGRRQVIQLVLDSLGKDHAKPNELITEAKAGVEKIKKFIVEKKILTLPNPDHCDIIEMPEFQRGFSVAYLNPAPPLDPKAKSFYAISPPKSDWDERLSMSFLKEYNRSMLQMLTIHEAYPGHYVQLEYSNRHPSELRRLLDSGVFAEGWAVYTEQMMLDQGYGDGDLSMRLHQLKWYLRAVVNAILDHRMHCKEMSDDEALKLLTEGGFQTEAEAKGKIVRAKLSSCQLTTYFYGRMAFYNLRQSVSRKLADKFDLQKFHEDVLSHGTLPVRFLPELIGK